MLIDVLLQIRQIDGRGALDEEEKKART
jgi:hypothetical protein